MNQIKKFLTSYAPKKSYFYSICCFIFIVSLIQKKGPSYLSLNHYTYEFGFINPWVLIHNNESLGIRRFIYALINSNMGIEWRPHYVLIDAALVCLFMALINFITHWLFNKAQGDNI